MFGWLMVIPPALFLVLLVGRLLSRLREGARVVVADIAAPLANPNTHAANSGPMSSVARGVALESAKKRGDKVGTLIV